MHIYYNDFKAAAAKDAFALKLMTCKDELESGKRNKKNESFYAQYFIVKETPVRGISVAYNNKAIEKHRDKYCGYFVLFSNDIKDPIETLNVYRRKDAVEKSFDDMKNCLDMKRLRVHEAKAMDSRIFLQFIALIYVSALRNRMKKSDVTKGMAVRDMLESMETYVKVSYAGQYGAVFTELTKTQRAILQGLNVDY